MPAAATTVTFVAPLNLSSESCVTVNADSDDLLEPDEDFSIGITMTDLQGIRVGMSSITSVTIPTNGMDFTTAHFPLILYISCLNLIWD